MEKPSLSPDTWIKLVNGHFADVLHGQYFPSGTSLVIQNGKIRSVGFPDEPAEVVIDLQGKTVIPGLFNTHCHIQLINGVVDKGELRQRQIAKNLADCLERGITNIRDTLSWDLRQNRTLQEKIGCGDTPGPRIHQAVHVGPIGGTYAPRRTWGKRALFSFLGATILPYDRPNSGVVVFHQNAVLQEVRDAVDRAIDERGAAMIKFCDQPEQFPFYKPGASIMSQSQLEATADQAAKRGIATTIHNVTAEGFRQSLRAGITSLAHIPIDQELTDDDLRLFSDSESLIEPTLTVGYYYCWNLPGNPWCNHPEINRLNSFRDLTYQSVLEDSWLPELRSSFAARREAMQAGSMKILGIFDLSRPFHFFASYMPVGGPNFRRVYEAGGRERLGVGSDATVSACSQAAVHLELELFDFCLNRDGKYLFNGADALRAATIQSARAMGLEKQFGSLEAGKTADLAILDGDALADFHCLGKPVAALFMDGKLVIDHCGLVQ